MTRYEYGYVARTAGGNLRSALPGERDHEVATSDNDDAVQRVLNLLGLDHWELVCTSNDYKHLTTFWLRRAVQDDGVA